MTDLPAHIKRELDAIAAGKARAATAAHPDCICWKPIRRDTTTRDGVTKLPPMPQPELGHPRDCPQHRKEGK